MVAVVAVAVVVVVEVEGELNSELLSLKPPGSLKGRMATVEVDLGVAGTRRCVGFRVSGFGLLHGIRMFFSEKGCQVGSFRRATAPT